MDAKTFGLMALVLFAPVFSYGCPDPEQRLQEVLKIGNHLAIVAVGSWTQDKNTAEDFGILKVMHGWGDTKRRLITYSGTQTLCKPAGKLKKGERYLVVLDGHKVVDMFKYSMAKKHLRALGDPDYKYTKKGVLEKEQGRLNQE